MSASLRLQTVGLDASRGSRPHRFRAPSAHTSAAIRQEKHRRSARACPSVFERLAATSRLHRRTDSTVASAYGVSARHPNRLERLAAVCSSSWPIWLGGRAACRCAFERLAVVFGLSSGLPLCVRAGAERLAAVGLSACRAARRCGFERLPSGSPLWGWRPGDAPASANPGSAKG